MKLVYPLQGFSKGPWRDIPHVGVLLDNTLITGETEEEHLRNTQTVLKRLSDAGLPLKRYKCQFMKPSLECLGHRIDAEGFHPVKVKSTQSVMHLHRPM